MQRIGRVDRRLDPEKEARIIADHPNQKEIRKTIVYWNFLPPDELNTLLSLYHKVTRKTLRISQTFGIEGGKLLRPEDDLEALREFNASYDRKSKVEDIKLEYDRLLKEYPDLVAQMTALPNRVFSGKRHPSLNTRAVFFCFNLPAADHSAAPDEDGQLPWTEEAGRAAWYLYDLKSAAIVDEPAKIVDVIRCLPDTPRVCVIEQPTLAEIRAKIEKHIKTTYLRSVQAPGAVKPALKAWMELNR